MKSDIVTGSRGVAGMPGIGGVLSGLPPNTLLISAQIRGNTAMNTQNNRVMLSDCASIAMMGLEKQSLSNNNSIEKLANISDSIRNIPLFSGLSEEALEGIIKLATRRTFPKHAVIINEGDETDSLYLISSGKVKVILSDEDGKEIIISILNAGDFFGELSLIDEEPRSACVVTMDACQFSIITKPNFTRFLHDNPEVTTNLLKVLSKRLRAANENIESLALMDVYGRVARTLLQYAKDVDGKMTITERLTQKDIANMIGASREMVSRIFKDLSTGGYITVDHGIITINEKLPHGW
ncbi:MAG: hypothetical protein BMS9Abin26_2157 [Gammaproteobacteria bacterium]|nr:MAG: hypothetical protein BMS9Abin26_2157 [Gammaproteobacteria bacterium]